ncbi:hypothetical protein TNCT_421071 [Trichonephila clavata]|uniref:Uncharacterized protein n=1 Tax=Trichonephila clavata TaxID=2740835 RepID=A0A8X6HZB5_TRICU|nr:hypothetical protein TNCT_421071 [Trichonephila clavata]
MKLLIIICVFVAITGPCVRAKSFNFANFFLGTKDSDSDSATASHSPSSETGTLFIESDRIEDGTEIDPLLFNSSEETLMEFEYQNSSSDVSKSLVIMNRKIFRHPPAAQQQQNPRIMNPFH